MEEALIGNQLEVFRPERRSDFGLAVDQGCLGGPETRIHARKGQGFAEISANQGIAHGEQRRRPTFKIRISGLLG